LLAVSRVVTSDGLGTSVQKDYTYSGGVMNFTRGVRDRKFSGFANSTETDANTITKKYFNQGDTVNTSLGEQSDGFGANKSSIPCRCAARRHRCSTWVKPLAAAKMYERLRTTVNSNYLSGGNWKSFEACFGNCINIRITYSDNVSDFRMDVGIPFG
jgi:hypothetical protein